MQCISSARRSRQTSPPATLVQTKHACMPYSTYFFNITRRHQPNALIQTPSTTSSTTIYADTTTSLERGTGITAITVTPPVSLRATGPAHAPSPAPAALASPPVAVAVAVAVVMDRSSGDSDPTAQQHKPTKYTQRCG